MSDKPKRHSDTARNLILNRALSDLGEIIYGHDPEINTSISNGVWDRLDKMALEIETRSVTASLDCLKAKLHSAHFRVKYTVESVTYVNAEPQDIDLFLVSDHPKGDGTEADLECHFFAWCVGEDGYEYDTREMAVILDASIA